MRNYEIDCSPAGLRALTRDALEYMKRLGYGPSWLDFQRRAWNNFVRFAEGAMRDDATFVDLVREFLAGRGIEEGIDGRDLGAAQRSVRGAMRSLTDYALHGCFQRRQGLVRNVLLPEAFDALVRGFVQHLDEVVGLARSSLVARRELATKFCHYLDTHEVSSVTDVEAHHLVDFIATRSYLRPSTLGNEASMLKTFLRYLCMVGLVPAELVRHVPRIRVRRHTRIPSVWTDEQVTALLGAVDRTSPKGKRDYAILLLAVRLGMRASDIRTLRLEELRWDDERIEYRQTKTGTPHTLPLTEELGEALIDYIRHGRPPTSHREVFLTAAAPFRPFGEQQAFYHILTDWRLRAGVKLPPPSRTGLHSLRHTVATRLLEAGTPLETIASVMGHVSPESARVYTKVGIEALRSAALDPEEVVHA